ncbi:MAG: restriction endonuclease subunit S [Proteobacteria bacterium]|nr:restriction endonuclease subunit S [Pseudomonadota bacterium]
MFDFPHWPVRLTGDVFYVKGRIGWRNLRRSDFCEDGPYLITGMHIGDSGLVDWDTCFHIPRHKFDESPEIQVQVGDLVITKDGTIGKVGRIDWLPGDTSLNSHLFLVRPIRPERSSSRFAFHVFNSPAFRRFIENQKSGSTLAGLGEAKFVKFEFPVPDFWEQELVTTVLDTLDTTIRETEAIIAKLKAVKQGLLHDLLTRGLDDNGELRPPQSEAPHLYKKSKLGWIPKEWELLTLGEIVVKSGGLLQTGPFGSQLHADEYTPDGIPVIMPQDMINDELSVANIARIPSRIARSLARHQIQYDDIIFSRRGDLSRCIAISKDQEGWLCGTGCLLGRFSPQLIDGYWLSQIYQQPYVQKQVLGMAVGSTMPNLNTSILSQLIVARPALSEQKEISSRLKQTTKKIFLETEELTKRIKQKSGLMDDLLTGRVRVTPLLNDPPDPSPEAAP